VGKARLRGRGTVSHVGLRLRADIFFMVLALSTRYFPSAQYSHSLVNSRETHQNQVVLGCMAYYLNEGSL